MVLYCNSCVGCRRAQCFNIMLVFVLFVCEKCMKCGNECNCVTCCCFKGLMLVCGVWLFVLGDGGVVE